MKYRKTSLVTVIVLLCGVSVTQAPPALANHNCNTSAYVEPRSVDTTAVGTHTVVCGGEMYAIELTGRLLRFFKENGSWVMRGLAEDNKGCSGDNLYRCQTNTYLNNPPGEQKWFAQTEACMKHEWYSIKECTIATSGTKYF